MNQWELAGELASPNFYHQGEYYARARYQLVDGIVKKRRGVPHGVPQADTISADAALAAQRKIYGHLRKLAAEKLRAGDSEEGTPSPVSDDSTAPEAPES